MNGPEQPPPGASGAVASSTDPSPASAVTPTVPAPSPSPSSARASSPPAASLPRPTPPGAFVPEPQRLTHGTHLKVFLRSLFLQASWNPQGMQNLGLAYALFPAMRDLYPDPPAQLAAVRRHLTFFNTHPYVAAAILGGVLFHEERIARGEESPDRVMAFKAALMGPLAALGDGFFWLSLRPATGAFCAAMVPLLGAWAALLFLILYNFVHLTLRARFFMLGLVMGDQLVTAVARAKLPTRGAKLRVIAAASAGGLAAWLAVVLGRNEGGTRAFWLAGGCLVFGMLTYGLVARRTAPGWIFYLVAGLACVVGALL